MEPRELTPRLIPDAVYEYAERLRQGTLAGAVFPSASTVVGWIFGSAGDPPDVPKMIPYLEAVADGDERKALETLAGILATRPLDLWNPYVQLTVRHLCRLRRKSLAFWVKHPPKVSRDQVKTVLNGFVIAWGYGLTGGKVSIRESHAKRGQTPQLFPALDEQDGTYRTPEAGKQHVQASQFAERVGDLKARLADRIRWRDLRNDYWDSPPAGKNTTVEEAAELLQTVFAETLQAWNQTTPPPSLEDVRSIARKALSVPRGRNPNDTATYELLALYPDAVGCQGRKLTPNLIKGTLETLAKRGILGQSGRRSRRRRD